MALDTIVFDGGADITMTSESKFQTSGNILSKIWSQKFGFSNVCLSDLKSVTRERHFCKSSVENIVGEYLGQPGNLLVFRYLAAVI